MSNQNQEASWNEIQSLWTDSTRFKSIRIELQGLADELKDKISPYEREAVKRDVEFIKNATSDFEKNSIKRDLDRIKAPLVKLLRKFFKN